MNRGEFKVNFSHAELSVLAEALEAENAKLKTELQAAREALTALSHEVRGALYMRQHDMRQLIGNTNFACITTRLDMAEAFLFKQDPRDEQETDP